eukprot:3738284-Pleurochrysis_carterae.AAC.1
MLWSACARRRVRADNKLGPEDGIALAEALKVNRSLTSLDLGCAPGLACVSLPAGRRSGWHEWPAAELTKLRPT